MNCPICEQELEVPLPLEFIPVGVYTETDFTGNSNEIAYVCRNKQRNGK
jgi:hypothetical protein